MAYLRVYFFEGYLPQLLWLSHFIQTKRISKVVLFNCRKVWNLNFYCKNKSNTVIRLLVRFLIQFKIPRPQLIVKSSGSSSTFFVSSSLHLPVSHRNCRCQLHIKTLQSQTSTKTIHQNW